MSTTYKEIPNMTQDNLIRVCVYLSIETRCCDYLSCQRTGDFAATNHLGWYNITPASDGAQIIRSENHAWSASKIRDLI